MKIANVREGRIPNLANPGPKPGFEIDFRILLDFCAFRLTYELHNDPRSFYGAVMDYECDISRPPLQQDLRPLHPLRK